MNIGQRAARWLLLLIVPLIVAHCREVPPAPGNNEPEPTIEPATQYTAGGGLLMLDGFKESYTLDEDIVGALRVINQTDSAGLLLHGDTKSPYRLIITPLQSIDIVFFDPSVFAYEEFYDTLRRGDTSSYQLVWSQKTWNSARFLWTELKAFSGTYSMAVFFRGNPIFIKTLTKVIEISDVGDPLCAALDIDLLSHDSLKTDLVIRNRISGSVFIEAADPLPLTVTILQVHDTLFAQQYPISPNALSLSPRSDKRMPFLRASYADSPFVGFHGEVNVYATLRLRSRIFAVSAVGYLP